MGIHMAYSFSEISDESWHACSLARAMTALKLVQNGCIYGIFYQAMLGQALACVQSRQSIHCSRTYTKRVYIYIYHILTVIAQTSLRMR